MKLLKILVFLVFFAAASAVAVSCGGNQHSESSEAKQGKEYTSAYVCPMHCEGSGSDEPGKCPKCGMEYKKNENHQPDGHDQSGHEGHNH
ncbi:MAG: hypothetical protein H6577_26540 [Lewinellaceae bacterium]|nr:hypothetical protein [Saprospiraceae bacterium]MCB9341700.1 hypothetical protein [Lewinellaceae bacterium]